MASRREHGAPSALTVLEVAEGLRWTDPALGASLAEHVRRVAGDDPAVRAAADRSVIRSLAESDRHEDVVERGVPLLAEARDRGDRDDGAEVLVELATAATGLGDPDLARRLLDRLGPVDELPARTGAGACAARAEACAADGDVGGADAAGDAAAPLLFRVAQADAAVLRARTTVARGIARRRAGDTAAALSVLESAVSTDPTGEVDGGRRSSCAAAEEIELLVESGRHDQARARAGAVLPTGAPGAHVSAAVGRIRLALAATSDDPPGAARQAAETLETAGRLADAGRAFETVAGLAETAGNLGAALTALRHGHALASRARDGSDRALRALAAVADGAEPLAPGVAGPASNGTGSTTRPTRRRERREDADGAGPAPGSTHESLVPDARPGRRADRAPREASAPEEPTPRPTPTVTAADVPAEPVVEPTVASVDEAGPVDGPAPTPDLAPPSTSARDELAELLASLTQSVDSSRAAASAIGLEPGPGMSDPVPNEDRDGTVPEAARHSRHAALPVPTSPAVAEPAASRPTFDAFSTAPTTRTAETEPERAAPAPQPEDRFAPVDDSSHASVPSALRSSEAESLSVSSLVDPLLDPLEPMSDPGGTASTSDTGRTVPDDEAPPAAPSAAPTPGSPRGEETSTGPDPGEPRDDPAGTKQPEETGRPTPPADADGTTVNGSPKPAPSRRRTGSSMENGTFSMGGPGGGPAPTAPAREPRASTVEERRDGSSSDTTLAPGADAPSRSARDSRSAGERENRDQRAAAAEQKRPATERAPRAAGPQEYEEELALTLASVLGEYHLPDVPMPTRRDRARPAPPADPPAGTAPPSEVAVPSARRHTSGSMPVPAADQRWAARPEASSGRPAEADGRSANGQGTRGRPAESGARLADLLAEAMDAFRHVGPEAQDGTRAPGVGSRRA